MQVIRGLHNVKPQHRGGVLTIGNFDGLHLGHQAMLTLMVDKARACHTHSCLMSFHPLPHEYFSALREPPLPLKPRLLNQQEKIRTLMAMPPATRPDQLLMLSFNQALAAMTAEAFVEQILVERLNIRALVIGDDFRFGCDRKGDSALLARCGEQHGFEVAVLDSHCVGDSRVSSTLIREALQNDRLELAAKMLGRTYTICGHVSHGDKRGRTIGFPTANIHIRRPETPLHGVYSVTMHTEKYGDVGGIANLGRRPTVNGERVQLEVHLFDFDQDLYGQYVCVSFLHKIRNEKKFDSFDDLKQQIETDCKQARDFLARKPAARKPDSID